MFAQTSPFQENNLKLKDDVCGDLDWLKLKRFLNLI